MNLYPDHRPNVRKDAFGGGFPPDLHAAWRASTLQPEASKPSSQSESLRFSSGGTLALLFFSRHHLGAGRISHSI